MWGKEGSEGERRDRPAIDPTDEETHLQVWSRVLCSGVGEGGGMQQCSSPLFPPLSSRSSPFFFSLELASPSSRPPRLLPLPLTLLPSTPIQALPSPSIRAPSLGEPSQLPPGNRFIGNGWCFLGHYRFFFHFF